MFCPICHKKPNNGLGKINGFFFCPNCHLGWQKGFSPVDYKEEYYQAKSSFISKLFQPIALFFYKLRSRYVSDKLKKLWIDVGAGEGDYLKTVKAGRKIGVEISTSGRKMMKKAGLETLADIDFLNRRDLNAEIISFWHVLEHMEKPWDYLEAAKKNLSRSGQIIIGVPNIDSLEFLYFGKDWFHFEPKYHLWYFSPRSLDKILKKLGLEIEKIDWWSPEHSLAGITQSLINKTSNSTNILHKLVKRQAGFSSLRVSDGLWIFFWLSLGLPLVFIIWIISSLFHRSDSVTIITSPIS